jgi:predicted AAA+ superfamily ATPase
MPSIAMYKKIDNKIDWKDDFGLEMGCVGFEDGSVLQMPKHWADKFEVDSEVIITLATKNQQIIKEEVK